MFAGSVVLRPKSEPNPENTPPVKLASAVGGRLAGGVAAGLRGRRI
jgi:hypothetical protein